MMKTTTKLRIKPSSFDEAMDVFCEKLEQDAQENTKLRIALCNLRDEYLNMGGDPNQLELFDKDNPSQLNIFNEEA